MDLNSPKSEPNTEKAEKDEIASKPDDTPKKSKTDYKDKKNRGIEPEAERQTEEQN